MREPRDASGALETLLTEERDLVRRGALEGLGALVERKAALLAEVGRQRPSPARLARLERMMRRNQRLLAAVLAGLRDAATRLGRIEAGGRGFQTYDQSGQRATIAGQRPGPVRRA